MMEYDVVVIGAGSAGRRVAREVGADRKTAIVTLNDDAGTLFERTTHTLALGHMVEEPQPHGPDLVDTYRGAPQFKSSKPILTIGDTEVAGKKFVIATGAHSTEMRIQGLDEIHHHTPLTIFEERKLPGKILVIGAGAIGCITAQKLAENKSSVTLLSRKESVLSIEEPELIHWFAERLSQQGIEIRTLTSVKQVREVSERKINVVFNSPNGQEEDHFEAVVLAGGYTPNSRGFGFEKQGVFINELNQVVVNDQCRTAASHIWACGSVTGPPFHLALSDYQAEVVSHNITSSFLNKIRMESEPFPMTVPTHPPMVHLGLTEGEAREKFKNITASIYQMVDRTYSSSSPKVTGLIKIIGKKRSGAILGVHMAGPCAEELVLYFNLAKRAEISLFELLDRQHYPSPTVGDSAYYAILQWIKEAEA